MATILVAYASKGGATAEIAEWIGASLRRAGATVEVKPAGDVTTIDGFNAIVVGGPLYMGTVLKPGPASVSRPRTELASRPVALFVSGGSLGKNDHEAEQKARAAAGAISGDISIAALGLFGGRVSSRNVPLIGRFLRNAMPEEDTRDRAAIEGWADALHTRLVL